MKECKVFARDKRVRFKFKINHSAQDVEYEMKEFVERNIDAISQALEDAMSG